MATWQTSVRDVVKSALVEKVDRNHEESDRAFLRRRIVVVVTLVVGATLLGLSLAVSPGTAPSIR